MDFFIREFNVLLFYFILISIFFYSSYHLFIYFCIACLVHYMHICKSFNWTYSPNFCLHGYNIQPLQHLFVYSIFHALDTYLHNMQRSIWTVCFLNEMQEGKEVTKCICVSCQLLLRSQSLSDSLVVKPPGKKAQNLEKGFRMSRFYCFYLKMPLSAGVISPLISLHDVE